MRRNSSRSPAFSRASINRQLSTWASCSRTASLRPRPVSSMQTTRRSPGIRRRATRPCCSRRAAHFRYIVWNYQTPKARPISYGVGEFRSFEVDGAHTRVTWTYSFKLKEDVFPGNLGGLGRFLFRVGFLDRDYAAMMRGVLNGYKASAEQLENRSSAHVGEEMGLWGQPGFGPGSFLCGASEARRWSRCPADPHGHDGS